ncbi:MAG TPA: VTT domain-containing protein [Candidatus Eisenbacteria bacterium]|jgi:membrane-associated protein|nr:VTT domain-containing protein [Candidatus Eisenbacteria bacterium]
MELIHEFFSKLHNLDQLVAWAGYAGLTAIVFCETGLLAGFFLPGDSLLVTAGFVASQGLLEIRLLNALLVVAAIAGDSAGFAIGRFAGPRLFRREDSFFFRKEYLERTHRFFERYGGKTIILARFVPIVRTFAPTVAGVGRMDYRRFLAFNVVGGALWVLAMTSIGYFLGKAIPNLEKSIHLVILAVIAVSFLPIVAEAWKARRR